MRSHAIPAIFTIALCVSGVATWVIDKESCKGKAFDYMNESLKSAFSFVDSAQAALSKTPLDAQTKELLQWMFEPDGTDADLGYAVAKLQYFYGWLKNQNKEGNEHYPYTKFYCNVDRFEKSDKHQGQWWDEDSKSLVQDLEGKEFDPQAHCKSPPILANPEFSDNTVFAFTLTNGDFRTVNICPWFLELVGKAGFRAKYSFSTWTKAKFMKLMSFEKRITKKEFKPIDVLQLFDKVLLHEMAHTLGNHITDDEGNGYGWDGIRALANAREGLKRYENADSIALFASCCSLIEEGFTIREDGHFTVPPEH